MSTTVTLPIVQSILSGYVLPIFYLFGIIGCIFNIIVFLQKTLRLNACSIYMLAINIVNFIEIFYAFGRVSIVSYLPCSSRPTSSVLFCRLISYFQHYLLNVVRTYTVLACIDRFALSSKNARIRKFSSISMARKLIILATIIWFIIPIHMLLFYDSISRERCGASGTYAIFFSIYSAIATGGHLILMVIFTLLAIYNIRKAYLRIQPNINQRNNNNTNNRIKKKDLQLIKMLTGEVIVYILTSTMFPIFNIYSVVSANTMKTPTDLAIEVFLAFLGPDFLVGINPCTTFYVNLCASESFRKICKHLILFKCRANDHSLITARNNQRGRTNGNHISHFTNNRNDDEQFF